jgi:hypothetical protein
MTGSIRQVFNHLPKFTNWHLVALGLNAATQDVQVKRINSASPSSSRRALHFICGELLASRKSARDQLQYRAAAARSRSRTVSTR